MAIIIAEGKQSYTDDAGVPLAGGLLYTWDAGTTTPRLTWGDSAQTAAHTNPIILDARGEATVFWNGAYKVELRTATGVVIWTVDDVTAMNDPISAATLAASGGSALVGFMQAGTGAVVRTAQAKMRDVVSVNDFGAVGDNVTDDTAAVQAALNTGKSIKFECGKVYRITAALSPMANGQIINLDGGKINFVGDFNGFNITGGLRNITICDGEIEGASQTGGYIISISNADRCTVDNIRVYNPYNFMYVEQANLVSASNVWVNNIRGLYGIHWFGNAVKRSDILRLIGVNLSSQDNAVGIMWDGNCNTLQVQAVSIVRASIGIHVRNTSGGPLPIFGLFDDIEIDFPFNDGVRLEVGEDFYFSPLLYCHGSVNGSGIYVATAVSQDRVLLTGGKITGHARYGIENVARRVIAGNLTLFGNALGDYLVEDNIYIKSPRIEVDATTWFSKNAGNPIINWDTNDVDGYIKGTNVRYFDVASVSRLRLSNNADSVEIYVGGVIKRIEVGAVDSGGVGYRMLRVAN